MMTKIVFNMKKSRFTGVSLNRDFAVVALKSEFSGQFRRCKAQVLLPPGVTLSIALKNDKSHV